MTTIEFDRPSAGWFQLDVLRKHERKWDWVALMIDVHPDDLKSCACAFPALFYVDPNEFRPGPRKARQGCLSSDLDNSSALPISIQFSCAAIILLYPIVRTRSFIPHRADI
ncbi:MAG: hypothetical protein WBD48_11860 [Pseudolabrys sp.]